eukprot:436346-Alexandrium_andersonii.AAC.1
MSASLVGSEMCIRDRKTSLAAQCPPALCVAILRGIAAQHACEGRTLPAVSYTHLTLPTICSV